ncbi:MULTISPECIES: hypothetical protein [Aphanizomenon]|uniref:hypothetical protein n=1 Tax=Aphanizomenon TaxID=1175 RepID=UPI0018EF5824|nr:MULTISPECIES: hypothetical protein [Aphanizomenon]
MIPRSTIGFLNTLKDNFYTTEYQDYQTFLQMTTEIEHQSCLILISQEKCQEMISLDNELYPIHSLELSGLNNAATEILKKSVTLKICCRVRQTA